MKTILSVLALALPLAAQMNLLPPPSRSDAIEGRTFYRWSLVAVIAANAADSASSWRKAEANPMVARPGAQFGTTSLALKSAFVVTSLVLQHIALRHRPDLRQRMAWVNLATSGVLTGITRWNVTVQ
jgi:hypothetical protein